MGSSGVTIRVLLSGCCGHIAAFIPIAYAAGNPVERNIWSLGGDANTAGRLLTILSASVAMVRLNHKALYKPYKPRMHFTHKSACISALWPMGAARPRVGQESAAGLLGFQSSSRMLAGSLLGSLTLNPKPGEPNIP